MIDDNYIELSEESFSKLKNLLVDEVGMCLWTEQELGSVALREILAYGAVYFYYIKGKE